MKNNPTIMIVIAIAIAGVAFFGGMQYQKSQQGSSLTGTFQRFPNGENQQMRRQGVSARSGGFTSGEIVSIDNNTVTIKTQDGSNKIVVYSDSTKISKTSDGSKSDLKVGERITAVGSESSGMITAQNISIGNGIFRMGVPGAAQPGQVGEQQSPGIAK
jgi:hypothetical protein